ncbi:hypothetical protein C1G87_1441 [Dehalococcoides mccartyi]|uniref:HTH merR-type domain-containing protein n=1 Tax=Dehalococcoides mccartyi TaxID=61435 RepID=A0A328ENP2_9CHLR|nr:hypothetical protein C1G87_1441 [Dehalococcoides mccartyi]
MEKENITSFLQIGEVAKRIGISQRSVRYYEEEGLIILRAVLLVVCGFITRLMLPVCFLSTACACWG